MPRGSDARVRGSQVERLWSCASEQLQDPLVGLHMSEAYGPGTLDLLGYIILSCATLGDVLERASRYARLLNDGMRIELVRMQSLSYCRITVVESMDNYLRRSPAHAVDATWGGFTRELRRLTAEGVVPHEVWLRRPRPPRAQQEEYRRVLGAPVVFDAPEDRFILSSPSLDVPILAANPALLAIFEQHADAVLGGMEKPGSRSTQVAAVLTRRLKGEVPPLKAIARELAMSARTLQRALQQDGTSFQRLVDDVRRELAIRHLSDPRASASQVGFLLGFSEPSTFHRAFRRWTGTTPGAYRSA